METTLTIQGMHCDACASLITMELEDAGFSEKVISVEVKENNMGTVTLNNVSDDDRATIKNIINNMEEYSVV